MKKVIKFLFGLIIVYIMIYACNKRLSSKYETNIRYNLEKEKQEKLLKEKELPAALYLDTIGNNSTIDDNPKEIEQTPEQKSFEKRWNKIVSKPDYEPSDLTGTVNGTTTSTSQVEKASQAPAGQFKKVLNEKK